MRIKFIHPGGWLGELERELARDHEIVDYNPDIILGMSIIKMPEIYKALNDFPTAKLVMYQWDMYDWAFENPRPGEYDYKAYVALIQQADLVFVPSEAERVRTKKRTGMDSQIIKSYTLTFKLGNPTREYVFNPLRELPDEHWGWAEKACNELGIPYIGSDRNLTFPQYKKILEGAAFVISPNKEASTGGLSLLEAYYNAKPVLINGNGENGGVDYFGERGYYFTSYEDLKYWIRSLWEEPPRIRKDFCRKWVDRNYSPQMMAGQIIRKIVEYQNNGKDREKNTKEVLS